MKKSKLKKQHAKMHEELVVIRDCTYNPKISTIHVAEDLKKVAADVLDTIDKQNKHHPSIIQPGWEKLLNDYVKGNPNKTLFEWLNDNYETPQLKRKLEDTHTGITLNDEPTTTEEEFKTIVQNYLGMEPRDLGCINWIEMQRKMVKELLIYC